MGVGVVDQEFCRPGILHARCPGSCGWPGFDGTFAPVWHVLSALSIPQSALDKGA